jgi:hypothetical protein
MNIRTILPIGQAEKRNDFLSAVSVEEVAKLEGKVVTAG